jgi:thiol:disulfide interchange protein
MLSTRATKLLLLGLIVFSVGVAFLALWARKPGPTKLTNWPPPLTDEQARKQLVSQCRAASDAKQPLLIEFSAPWCQHCKAVKRAVTDQKVAHLLSAVRPVVLNIGEDAELNELRLEFGARAIPAWVVVSADSCDAPPAQWKQHGQIYPRGEPAELVVFLTGVSSQG